MLSTISARACTWPDVTRKQARRFSNAVRLAPNDADALNNLGAVYYVLEQYDRALESFQKATAAKPDSADAHYNLANAYYMSGRNREAADGVSPSD